jgi:hypothetical protein
VDGVVDVLPSVLLGEVLDEVPVPLVCPVPVPDPVPIPVPDVPGVVPVPVVPEVPPVPMLPVPVLSVVPPVPMLPVPVLSVVPPVPMVPDVPFVVSIVLPDAVSAGISEVVSVVSEAVVSLLPEHPASKARDGAKKSNVFMVISPLREKRQRACDFFVPYRVIAELLHAVSACKYTRLCHAGAGWGLFCPRPLGCRMLCV